MILGPTSSLGSDIVVKISNTHLNICVNHVQINDYRVKIRVTQVNISFTYVKISTGITHMKISTGIAHDTIFFTHLKSCVNCNN